MKKKLLHQKRLFGEFIPFYLFLLFANLSWAQTTVFSDDFNRSAVSPGGLPSVNYTTASTAATSGTTVTVSTARLEIKGAGTSGRTFMTGPLSAFSSDFNTTLSSNTGIITWTFTIRGNKSTILGQFFFPNSIRILDYFTPFLNIYESA